MKTPYLTFVGLLLFSTFLSGSLLVNGQTILLDFESPETSTTYQYFGSDLEPGTTSIIENPNPSGINTSAMVSDFMRPANAQPWAGAFPNPALTNIVDVTNGGEICIKVHAANEGNVAIKLEGSLTDGPDWIRTEPITQTNEWVDICFNVAEPSIEAPEEPAEGHIYPTVVLFFNFQQEITEDQTYYFDDLVVFSEAGTGDVTFSVNMSEYEGDFETVYVSGEFNEWSGEANPMSDDDGDNVWTTTIPLTTGAHEYKFTLDNWNVEEVFQGGEPCTVTDPSGMFINRTVAVAGDTETPIYCFNECFGCGEAISITLNVGTSHIEVDSEGIFVAGGQQFGNPGDYPLLDEDGDGVYSITIIREKGFESLYTLTNGNCGDYSCKENIAGQDCAFTEFNDRLMGPVMQDTIISTCFGFCIDEAACDDLPAPGDITFQVDMQDYTASFDTVYIGGDFNEWSDSANPLSDDDGDGIWTTTLTLQPGVYEYKFHVDKWFDAEGFMDNDPCTVTDDTGEFINRVLTVDGTATLDVYCFGSCEMCDGTGLADLINGSSSGKVENLFSLNSNLVNDVLTLQMNPIYNDFNKTISVFDINGKLILEKDIDLGVSQSKINTSSFNSGMYIISLHANDFVQIEKLIVE